MATPVKHCSLEDVLLRRGLLSQEQLTDCVQQARHLQQPLRQYVAAHSLLSEEAIAKALAEQYALPFDPLMEFRVNPAFFETIPVEWMHRQPFVPLSDHEGTLTIAVADPRDLWALDELELLLSRDVHLVVSTATAILEGLAASEGNKQVLTRIQEELHPILIKEDERGEEVLSLESISKDQSPVVKLVDTIILSALQKQVSDIHIEATERAVDVKFRIDGVLYSGMEPLPHSIHASLIS